tara:strand:- start:501 stop:1394 length:894 start_codon:yes stop_codon:yes gene_type:complete
MVLTSGLLNKNDESDIASEVSSGRIGKGFGDLGSENTASLGIKKPIADISRSMEDIIGDKGSSNYGEFADAFQFVTAKIYENREAIGKATVSASIKGTKASSLQTARTIGGVSFDGSANINLPGVNASQTSKGLTWAGTCGGLTTSKTIGGVSYNHSANIIPKQHKGSITKYYITPTDFESRGTNGTSFLTSHLGGRDVTASATGVFVCNVTLPIGLSPTHVVIYGSDTGNTVNVHINQFANATTAQIDGGSGFAVGTDTSLTFGKGVSWSSDAAYLTITVTTTGADSIYGGIITMA